MTSAVVFTGFDPLDIGGTLVLTSIVVLVFSFALVSKGTSSLKSWSLFFIVTASFDLKNNVGIL